MGLYDLKQVQHFSTQHTTQKSSNAQNTTSSQQKCILDEAMTGKNQRVIKSLGTNVESVTVNMDNYVIKYTGGDECFYSQKKQNFSSELRFICDHDEEEGWPRQIVASNITASTDMCHLVFEWRSKHACRQCMY